MFHENLFDSFWPIDFHNGTGRFYDTQQYCVDKTLVQLNRESDGIGVSYSLESVLVEPGL